MSVNDIWIQESAFHLARIGELSNSIAPTTGTQFGPLMDYALNNTTAVTRRMTTNS